jgi:hypothetical protein
VPAAYGPIRHRPEGRMGLPLRQRYARKTKTHSCRRSANRQTQTPVPHLFSASRQRKMLRQIPEGHPCGRAEPWPFRRLGRGCPRMARQETAAKVCRHAHVWEWGNPRARQGPLPDWAEAKAPSGTGRMFLCPTLSKEEGMHACSQCFTCAHPSQARPTLYPPGHPHMNVL